MLKGTGFNERRRKNLITACQLLILIVYFFWPCRLFSQDRMEKASAPPGQTSLAKGPENDEQKPCCAAKKKVPESPEAEISGMNIPDVELLDQEGKKVHFYRDLVKGKVVAMNFIFTTCTTICPPLTANFSKIQNLMGDRIGRDFTLISISVDPVNDTPQRLKAWGEKFGAKPGWTFLTGKKQDVDKLLKALKVFTPSKEDHTPFVIVGNDAQCQWTRVYGLTQPTKLVQVIDTMIGHQKKESITEKDKISKIPVTSSVKTGVTDRAKNEKQNSTNKDGNQAARNYFSDTELVNQHGETMRFYSDLIQRKIVVINCFYTECIGICPVLNKNLFAIQEALGDRLGKDVNIISLSVDPVTDTPQILKSYAEKYHAKPGWYFLSGKKENVDQVLSKLGFSVEERDQHTGMFIIGNDMTGLWKKALGLAKSEELIRIMEGVLHDAVN